MLTNCQLLLQNLPGAILQLDRDGYIRYSNLTTTSLTGFSSEELLNKPLAILYPGSDATKSEYELSLAKKKSFFISEAWKAKKDGSTYWGEITLAVLKDEEGEHVGYTCMLTDKTKQKQEEIELRQSEERYRLMVGAVKDYAIFMLDTKGHILTWNEGAKRNKGYTAQEIIGKHFSIFYTAPDLESKKPERELEIAVRTGKYEEEGWRVRKNGSLFWANVVITALFNESNQHIGFAKVTRDLSDKKEKEEQLKQSEERFRSLVEQVTDYGIFLMDEEGRIVSWNEGARRISGYEASEIIGKYFSIFYPDEDILNGKPAMEMKVARTEGKYEEEGWRLRKDGSRFWANIVLTAVYNTDGTLLGYSKVTRDLTERKQGERALRDSHDRYRQLAEELRKTNSELTYANEELEQFTSIVSHDLQEPVRTIKSFLQLIEMKLPDEQSRELKTYIGKSINAANRMKDLIQNLLHYSQLSRGEMIKEKISVSDLFQEALQNLKTSIDASGATITIQNGVEEIYGDKVQLVQLIQNLISNALKFTANDHPSITIRSTRSHGGVKFAVSDNGIGIAETDKAKVFDIFRRLNTEKSYPGTGIGLAICKKIVDRHRGQIWPESEIGKGTTFYFTIKDQPANI
jgi:PAS domain S-box-containing protein